MTTQAQDDEAILRRLRWQCRRGMKELDFLLLRWLEAHFIGASASDRHNFERLLKVEDDQLWAWFVGRSHSQDPELDALVQRIRGPA